MNKFAILVILFIIALVIAGYFSFYANKGSEPEGGATNFRGPAGAPYVNGPSSPPPGTSY